MSDRGKRIFLGICIIVPFILYCYTYYSSMLRNAPFRFADFEAIELRYGVTPELENRYSTRTGVFQYVNTRDSLALDSIRMRKDDLLYLHRKAAEMGFWNLPEEMHGQGFDKQQSLAAPDSTEGEDDVRKVVRYELVFRYKEKSKTV